jgi:hypothetical protein
LRTLANQGDKEAEYQLAMELTSDGETFIQGIEMLELIADAPWHPRTGKAKSTLATFHESDIHPRADINKAISLFEKVAQSPTGVMSRLFLGLLYCEGRPEHKPDEGKKLFEGAVQELINEDGDDSYLQAHECLRIAKVYLQGGTSTNKTPDVQKATEYLNKTVARCRDADAIDDSTKEEALENLNRMR